MSNLNTKFLIGVACTFEVNQLLQSSKSWHQDTDMNLAQLKIIKDNDCDYLGLFVDAPIDLAAIKKKESELREILNSYSVKILKVSSKIYIIPQIFIG